MKINIEKNSKIPLYVQIKNQIKDMIYSKIIPVDYVLPSERELAKTLKINRSTVVKSYEELKMEGIIDSKMGKGTYVIYSTSKTRKTNLNNHCKSLF